MSPSPRARAENATQGKALGRSAKKSGRVRELKVRSRGDGLRTCISCGQEAPPDAFIRLVAEPEGGVSVDIRRRRTGRGAHVCPDPACIEGAVRKQRLSRQLKEPVSASPDGLIEAARSQLFGSVLFFLSLAQKAGRLVSGVDAVCKEASRGAVQVIVVSSDIAASSLEQLEAIAGRTGGAVSTLACSGEVLGHGIGREVRVAVGVRSGELAAGLKQELLRLAQLEGGH